MKNFLRLTLFLYFIFPGLSTNCEAYSEPNLDAQMLKADRPGMQKQSSDTQGSDDFFNEMIYEQYGSIESPAFMNRENINPNESDYGYGGSDGYQ